MKLSFLSSIKQFAITHLGAVLDKNNDMTALMQRNGMLSDSDGCDGDPFLDDGLDSDDFDPDEVPARASIEPDYIKRHIARIPQYGDDSRWRLADYLNMFDNLSRDGSLTNEQQQAVDNFAIGWQAADGEECEGCEMDFPESQYVAVGLDLESAQQLGDIYRAGKSIPQIGDEVADRISNRLNQMQSRRTTLEK